MPNSALKDLYSTFEYFDINNVQFLITFFDDGVVINWFDQLTYEELAGCTTPREAGGLLLEY